ncbi:MAG: 50S ribosomal protein L25/general stress protein Ctc [Alphaproteobacteria bacterium]|nr:50S ribosomal protein L25/general stress protein Ctc [Alphaproteobacteria bacterium]
MSKQYTLAAEKREKAGKGSSRAIRRENRVPAVIYGDNKPPVTITLVAKDLVKEYHKGHMFTNLCELAVGSEKTLVLARDVQVHPVTDRPMHVDFMRVSPKTQIHVSVPIEFINQDKSPGMKAKGVLNIVYHELHVVCPANNIPESIQVDLSGLEIGDAAYLSSNVTLPQGVKVETKEDDMTLCTIQQPKEDKAPEPTEAAAAAPGAEGAAAAPAAGAAAAPAKEGDKK